MESFVRAAAIGQVQPDLRLETQPLRVAPRIVRGADSQIETPVVQEDSEEERKHRHDRFMQILEEAKKRSEERKTKGLERKRSLAAQTYSRNQENPDPARFRGVKLRTSV